MAVPAVLGRTGHLVRHKGLDVVAQVIAAREDNLRVGGQVDLTVEESAIRQIGIDVGIAFGPVFLREVTILITGKGNRHLVGATGHHTVVIQLVVGITLYDVAAGSGSACPFRLIVLQTEQRGAVSVDQGLSHVVGHLRRMTAVLQLSVGQRTGSIDIDQCAHGEGSTLGGTCHELTIRVVGSLEVVPVLYLVGSLQHLVGNEVGALLVGAAGDSQILIRHRVVGSLVGHEGNRTVFAQQQPVVVGTHETGLSSEVGTFLLGHLLVAIDVVDEHRGLIDTLVGIDPGVLTHLFVVVTQHQRIETGASVTVAVEFGVAVAENHIVAEALEIGTVNIGELGLTVGQGTFEEGKRLCQPAQGLVSVGEHRFQRSAVIEVLVGVQFIGTTGEGHG